MQYFQQNKNVSINLSLFPTVLFHRAISLSGTAFSPHAIIRDPYENTKKLAQKLSCKTTTSNSLISCLKTLPANKITEVIPSLYVSIFKI